MFVFIVGGKEARGPGFPPR